MSQNLPETGRSLRILIIAHSFPPMNATAAHRPYSWARVWRDLGHEIHVLTPVKHPIDWAGRHRPDVLCLQETKLQDEQFPAIEIRAAGYAPLANGQKTYNGVAILTRAQAGDPVTAIPGFADEQKRVLAATVGPLRVICAYVPNGESIASEKYPYKLKWLEAFRGWLKDELARHPQLAVLGDFNVAPEDRDVHDPKAWEGQVLFSAPEREAFGRLIGLGLKDAFRLFEQPERSFTWWDYRMNAFRRKMGLRIDHILLSEALAKACTACTIDVEPRRSERPSDHAPVIAELDLVESGRDVAG